MKNPEHQHRILYAEDNEDACFMISVLLGFSDIKVTAAGTIREALFLSQTEHFDLYLLDSRFPDGSGLDLCRRLRKTAPRTPILFYSGAALESDKQNGLLAGADAYLTKPHINELDTTILRYVNFSKKTEDKCFNDFHRRISKGTVIEGLNP